MQALVRQQAATIVRLEATIAQQAARIAELEQQLDDAQRRSKRQATPFAKGAPKAEPKKPGRKAGHPAAHRAKPSHIDRELEASLPDACPHCGGPVQEDEVQPQYQEDIPRPVKPVVTQFNVHIGHCEQCARRVQGRHSEQTSDALGGAAVQLGPNVLALGAELKHVLGVSYGKVARFCQRSFGLPANRSSFARADQRLAQQWQPSYRRLLVQLRQSSVIHVDETGWKIGGHSAWLWVFTNEQLSVYLIDPSRGHAVVESILGTDFAGVLVSDCFLAYDPLGYVKAKCAGHLLKRCGALLESGNRTTVQFSQQLARLLRGGITLKARQARLSPHGYRVACGKLEAALDRLLERHYRQPDTACFAKLLRKQREHLFTFLYVAEVAPTNNAAERELRPAVIIRKTNGCNRSQAGATAHSVLSSVIRTCEKQGLDFIDQTRQVLQTAGAVLLDLCGSDTDPPVRPAEQATNPARLPVLGVGTASASSSP
ncbi:MAG: IS66 family transposase [Chloroflexi bacterium]|nr:IS66 family transposase [Chloroflexota bacterium]